MESETYSFSKIAKLIKGKHVRQTEKYVTFMLKTLLKRRGIPVLEELEINGLVPDLAIVDEDCVVSIIEVVSPEVDLKDEAHRRKFEKVVLSTFAYIIKPKRLALTNGITLIIYNSNLKPIRIIEDLENVSQDEEERLLREMVSPPS